MLQYLKAENGTHSTLIVKKVSDTRWSARSDAILCLATALSKGYGCFLESLKFISEDENQKTDTRYEAITYDLWAVILERFNQVSKSLQQETRELDSAIKLF